MIIIPIIVTIIILAIARYELNKTRYMIPSDKGSEPKFFKNDDSEISFTKVEIHTIRKNKAYQGRFLTDMPFMKQIQRIETTINGESVEEVIKKTEAYLITKLKPEQYSEV